MGVQYPYMVVELVSHLELRLAILAFMRPGLGVDVVHMFT